MASGAACDILGTHPGLLALLLWTATTQPLMVRAGFSEQIEKRPR
jgi:hypothetical protein